MGVANSLTSLAVLRQNRRLRQAVEAGPPAAGPGYAAGWHTGQERGWAEGWARGQADLVHALRTGRVRLEDLP